MTTITTAEPATMTVRVIDHGTGPGYTYPVIRTIAIGAYCPKCGGRRGEPRPHNFCEDGGWLTCDRWTNPCGHLDLYRDLLAERRRFVDANGDRVPLPDHVAATFELRVFMAGRVPAPDCPHYMAKSEADAGLTRCEHCTATSTV